MLHLTRQEVIDILKVAYARGVKEHTLQKPGKQLEVDVKNLPDFVIEDIITKREL